MANLRDLNNGGGLNPLVDFLNTIVAQGQDHPLFAAFNPEARDRGEQRGPQPPQAPPGETEAAPPYPGEGPAEDPGDPASPPPPPEKGPGPHRGPGSHHGHRGGHPHGRHHHGPPPPHDDDPFSGHGFPFGGPFGGGPGSHPHRAGGPPHGHRGGWGGFAGRGGPASWGGPRGRCGGGWGRRSAGHPFVNGWGNSGNNFDMSKLGEFLSQFAPPGTFPTSGDNNSNKDKEANGDNNNSSDFRPPVDIFDTPAAYIIHASLPGAQKSDIAANWDADRSELAISGVIYRPGDEETLKALALDEREVGVFERKVALGTKERPAAVVAEEISAKMEDGVLIVRVPKVVPAEEGEEGFVEVRKVEIE